MAMLGPEGLEKLALRTLSSTQSTMSSILSIDGVELHNQNSDVFREFAVKLPGSASEALICMDKSGVLGGFDLGQWWESMSDTLLIGCDERTTDADIDALTNALRDWVMEEAS